jgi:hypothetical protein
MHSMHPVTDWGIGEVERAASSKFGASSLSKSDRLTAPSIKFDFSPSQDTQLFELIGYG